MDDKLILGKPIADQIKDSIRNEINEYAKIGKRIPKLVNILVGGSEANAAYLRGIERACEYTGMDYELIQFDESTSEFEIKKTIHRLNKQQSVDGILLQMPLPKTIDAHSIIFEIDPQKDVDGVHPVNIGLFTSGQKGYVPCTALSAMAFVEASGVELEGKQVVIVGRSNVVGKPVAQLCLRKNATVTIVHSKTKDIEKVTKLGDVVIVAVGQAKLIKKDWLKPGAVVIDVGINVDENHQLCGDVDLEDVISTVSKISPVPRGVGAVTPAMLLSNVMESYRKRG